MSQGSFSNHFQHLQGRSGDPTAVGGKAARQPWKIKGGHENMEIFFGGRIFSRNQKNLCFLSLNVYKLHMAHIYSLDFGGRIL